MILNIIRVLLVWWLLATIFRIVDRYFSERKTAGEVQTSNDPNVTNGTLNSIDHYPGEIEDADFEEIDSA